MDINELLGELKAEKPKVNTVTIDVSAWLGEGAELTLKEADTASLFAASQRTFEIKKNYAGWPDSLCQNTALLGNCHLSPAIKGAAEDLYIQLAAKRRDCFMHVLEQFQSAFASTLGQAADDAKND